MLQIDLHPLKNGRMKYNNTMSLQTHKYQQQGNFEDHFIYSNNR